MSAAWMPKLDDSTCSPAGWPGPSAPARGAHGVQLPVEGPAPRPAPSRPRASRASRSSRPSAVRASRAVSVCSGCIEVPRGVDNRGDDPGANDKIAEALVRVAILGPAADQGVQFGQDLRLGDVLQMQARDAGPLEVAPRCRL